MMQLAVIVTAMPGRPSGPVRRAASGGRRTPNRTWMTMGGTVLPEPANTPPSVPSTPVAIWQSARIRR